MDNNNNTFRIKFKRNYYNYYYYLKYNCQKITDNRSFMNAHMMF